MPPTSSPFSSNNTITELGAFVAANERRAKEDRLRLERLVNLRTNELRESETNFRTLLATAPVPILLVGLDDDRVRFCNERAADLFNTTVDEIVDRPTPAPHPAGDARQRFRQQLERDRRIDAHAVEAQLGHGSSFWSLLNARVLSSEGEPVIMMTLTDVTEQKRVEHQLRELATTDMLTGAFTRRHFFDLAELEWVRSTRHQHPLCVG
jgi:PAS domain S-box-containing protein